MMCDQLSIIEQCKIVFSIRFMYQGEVHIGQEQLKEFLRAAQLLQVRGLTDVPPPAPLTNLEQKASPVSN